MAAKQDWQFIDERAGNVGFPEAACILELSLRVESMEASLKSICRALDLFNSKYSKSDASPVATDAELYEIYDGIPRTTDSLRAIYNLGRKHGALAAQMP